MSLSVFGGLDDLAVTGLGITKRDVFAHAGSEEESVLHDKTDLTAQRANGGHLAVTAVKADAAGCWLVKAGDQIDQRRFARTGGPHQGHNLPRLNGKADIVENWMVRLVAKRDMLKLDTAVQPRQWFSARRVGHLFGGIQDGENALSGRSSDSQNGDDATHITYRPH